jgi:hypothetical protein
VAFIPGKFELNYSRSHSLDCMSAYGRRDRLKLVSQSVLALEVALVWWGCFPLLAYQWFGAT